MTEILELVDGRLREPASVLDDWLTHPDTGARIGRQRASTRDSIELAITLADQTHASGRWLDVPPADRVELLRRFAAELAAGADQLAVADSVDSGVPIAVTRTLIAGAARAVATEAERAAMLRHAELSAANGPADQYWLPWGPAAIFVPWNAPATMALRKTAAALAVGTPVVLKPSQWAPHSSGLIAQAASAAGLPPGALQVLHGGAEVGQALAADPRIAALSYTGGSAGGRAVAAASARLLRPVDLELAGANPVIVLADAEIERAAALLAAGMRFLNGQWCAGPRRVFAPASMTGVLADAILAAHEADTVVGPIADAATTLGPMAYLAHLTGLRDRLAAFAAAGARVRTAGALPPLAGHFLLPTVVTDVSAELNRTEVFGPVITVSAYRDVDEAIDQANDHPYGLRGYVLTADRDAGRAVGRRIRAGHVVVNDSGLGPRPADAVISMWGASGLGTVGAVAGSRFFTGARFVG